MRILLLLMFSIVLLGSCSLEKTLSEQIKYDWDIYYNLSKDDDNERQINVIKNLKNSSLHNQTEVQASLQTVENNQNFLASKDKVEPSVLTNNYSYKKLPQIIQNERINKSFSEKAQIFENEKITNKKFKINDKTKKILKIIGASILIGLTGFFHS